MLLAPCFAEVDAQGSRCCPGAPFRGAQGAEHAAVHCRRHSEVHLRQVWRGEGACSFLARGHQEPAPRHGVQGLPARTPGRTPQEAPCPGQRVNIVALAQQCYSTIVLRVLYPKAQHARAAYTHMRTSGPSCSLSAPPTGWSSSSAQGRDTYDDTSYVHGARELAWLACARV